MKAISLWQPWASLLVLGSKTIETRSCPTHYRGPLLIHAAKRKNISELIYYGSCWAFHAAFHPIGGSGMGKNGVGLYDLPFGAIIGQVDLVDCRPTGSFTGDELDTLRYPPGVTHMSWTERVLGNFERGRYGWVMANPKVFETPIPFKGSQGFFEVPKEVILCLQK